MDIGSRYELSVLGTKDVDSGPSLLQRFFLSIWRAGAGLVLLSVADDLLTKSICIFFSVYGVVLQVALKEIYNSKWAVVARIFIDFMIIAYFTLHFPDFIPEIGLLLVIPFIRLSHAASGSRLIYCVWILFAFAVMVGNYYYIVMCGQTIHKAVLYSIFLAVIYFFGYEYNRSAMGILHLAFQSNFDSIIKAMVPNLDSKITSAWTYEAVRSLMQINNAFLCKVEQNKICNIIILDYLEYVGDFAFNGLLDDYLLARWPRFHKQRQQRVRVNFAVSPSFDISNLPKQTHGSIDKELAERTDLKKIIKYYCPRSNSFAYILIADEHNVAQYIFFYISEKSFFKSKNNPKMQLFHNARGLIEKASMIGNDASRLIVNSLQYIDDRRIITTKEICFSFLEFSKKYMQADSGYILLKDENNISVYKHVCHILCFDDYKRNNLDRHDKLIEQLSIPKDIVLKLDGYDAENESILHGELLKHSSNAIRKLKSLFPKVQYAIIFPIKHDIDLVGVMVLNFNRDLYREQQALYITIKQILSLSRTIIGSSVSAVNMLNENFSTWFEVFNSGHHHSLLSSLRNGRLICEKIIADNADKEEGAGYDSGKFMHMIGKLHDRFISAYSYAKYESGINMADEKSVLNLNAMVNYVVRDFRDRNPEVMVTCDLSSTPGASYCINKYNFEASLHEIFTNATKKNNTTKKIFVTSDYNRVENKATYIIIDNGEPFSAKALSMATLKHFSTTNTVGMGLSEIYSFCKSNKIDFKFGNLDNNRGSFVEFGFYL